MQATSFVRHKDTDNQSTLLVCAVVLPALLVTFGMIAQSAVAESFCAVSALSIALPPLLAAIARPFTRLIAVGFSTLVIALLLLTMPVSFSQWFGVVAIIASVGIFLAGIIAFIPSAVVTILMLLWLSWPIWLSERLAGHSRVVNAIAAVHPLLAVNGQLLDQAIWTERPLMYGWTGLNQDVPFTIPTSVLWCALLHGGIGIALVFVSRVIRRAWFTTPSADGVMKHALPT